MINFESDKYKEFQSILTNSIQSGNYEDWARVLDKNENSSADGFINFFSLSNSDQILKKLGFNNLKEWLEQVNEWNLEIHDPRNNGEPEALILYQLWSNLIKNLTISVRNSRLIADIPRKGGVLYYLGGMSKCIILKYEIVSAYPKFHFVDLIDNPKSVFDFWGIISFTGTKEKNILKEILSTGHKMVYHRGVLIHVDRRKDIEVFGPTIDTILIAEILTQQLYETENLNFESALEIGCGNGLITVSMAKNFGTINSLKSIDINFGSVNCCHRNLRGNLNAYRFDHMDIHLSFGNFQKELFGKSFDLIVCNPPYIPLLDESFDRFHSKRDYFEAVGGLSLIDEIMNSLSEVLTRKGKLLILVSSVSIEYTLSKIPNGFSYNLPIEDGFEVFFDVEAVLNNPDWLDFLAKSGGVTKKENAYYHKLYPIWVYNK